MNYAIYLTVCSAWYSLCDYSRVQIYSTLGKICSKARVSLRHELFLERADIYGGKLSHGCRVKHQDESGRSMIATMSDETSLLKHCEVKQLSAYLLYITG